MGSATFNGYTYFVAFDAPHGHELWRTDGTAAGTTLFKDINPIITPIQAYGSLPQSFMLLKGWLLFLAKDGNHPSNWALWRSDGTEAGTVKLGANIDHSNGLEEEGWYLFNGKLMGLGNDGLVESDVTPEGTRIVVPDAFSDSLVATSDRLYWLSGSQGSYGVRSWDGTTVRTEAVAVNLYPTTTPLLSSSFGTGVRFGYHRQGPGNSIFWEVVQLAPREKVVRPYQERFHNQDNNDEIEFRGMRFYNDASAFRLWRAGATPDQDVLIHDIDQGSLTISGDRLFFKHNTQLWMSDGTPEGTVLVRDFAPGQVGQLLGTDSDLFFRLEDELDRGQPWRSDGTASGTVQAADVSAINTSRALAYSIYGLARHGSNILVGTWDRLWMIPNSADRASSPLTGNMPQIHSTSRPPLFSDLDVESDPEELF